MSRFLHEQTYFNRSTLHLIDLYLLDVLSEEDGESRNICERDGNLRNELDTL